MSRIAQITVAYESNLSALKSEWDAFLAHVEQNQPRVNGQPISAALSPAAQRTTFSGLTGVAGVGTQTDNPGYFPRQQFSVSGPGFAAGGGRFGLSGMSGDSSPTTSRLVDAMTRLTTVMEGAGRGSGGGGGSSSSGGGASTSNSEDGIGGSLSRGRNFLRRQGFGRVANYLGAIEAVQFTTDYLNQQNKFAIAQSGATTAQQTIAARVEYQQNSPFARIPFVGALGAAYREFSTGDQAFLAGRGAENETRDRTFDIRRQTFSQGLAARAGVAGAGGDFAGQRESLRIGSENAIFQARTANAGRIGEISQAIAGLTDGGRASQLSTADYDKLQALREEIKALNAQSASAAAGVKALTAAQQAQLNRQEAGFRIGAQSRINALDLQFTDERGSELEHIRGSFNARAAAAVPGSVEQRAAQQEGAAAVRAAQLGFLRTDYFAGQDLRVGGLNLATRQLSNQNYDYTARYANINAQGAAAQVQLEKETKGVPQGSVQFEQAIARLSQALAGLASDANKVGLDFSEASRSITAGTAARRESLLGNPLAASNIATQNKYDALLKLHPELAAELKADRGVEYQENAVQDQLRRYGISTDTRSINQSTDQQNLRNRYLNRTADVQGIITGGANAIELANVQLRGSENDQLRKERIDAIRGNVESSIYGQLNPLQHSNQLEQVGAFITRGDSGNQNYRDLRSARALAASASGALDAAEGSNPINIPPAIEDKSGGGGQVSIGNSPTQDQMQQVLSKLDQAISLLQQI